MQGRHKALPLLSLSLWISLHLARPPTSKTNLNLMRDHCCRPSACTWDGRRRSGTQSDLTHSTKSWASRNFCFIKFSQKHLVWAAWTSRTTLWPPPPGGWGQASPNLAKDTLGVEPHLCVKFQPCSPYGAGTYCEHTHTHIRTNIASLTCFQFRLNPVKMCAINYV